MADRREGWTRRISSSKAKLSTSSLTEWKIGSSTLLESRRSTREKIFLFCFSRTNRFENYRFYCPSWNENLFLIEFEMQAMAALASSSEADRNAMRLRSIFIP